MNIGAIYKNRYGETFELVDIVLDKKYVILVGSVKKIPTLYHVDEMKSYVNMGKLELVSN
jgi:hypothetical protein